MMFQLIVGIPVFFHPRSIRERVLMGCLIMLSLFYLSDFYSKITDLQLTFKPIPLQGFIGLDKSQLLPLVNPTFFNWTFIAYFEEDRSVMQSLKNKAKLWYNSESCADHMMFQNTNEFCILPESLGREMVEKFRSSDSRRLRLRLMEPCFLIAWKSYAFTPGSPYVEKFDKVLMNVLESGLIIKWKKLTRTSTKTSSKMPFKIGFRDMKREKNKTQMKLQMALVIGVGMTASASVFIAEIILRRMNTKWLKTFKSVFLI